MISRNNIFLEQGLLHSHNGLIPLPEKVKFSFTTIAISFSSGSVVIEAEKLPWQIQQPKSNRLKR
jgi:hypothetical protein